jgi:hypothetical protein
MAEYDGASDVMFNSVSYNPVEIRLFKPSLHKFNGTNADAELVIVHTGTNGGLLVCIPIGKSVGATSSMGSTMLESIIEGTKDGESVSLNLQNFNANHFIPKSGYYSYQGSLLYGDCKRKELYNYVVFPPQSLKISVKMMNRLGNIIHDADVQAVSGDCYWNEKGTMNNGFAGEGQIYIDCQPTDDQGEIVYKEPATPQSSSIDFTYFWTFLYVIIGMFVMFILIKIMKFVFVFIPEFTPPKPESK